MNKRISLLPPFSHARRRRNFTHHSYLSSLIPLVTSRTNSLSVSMGFPNIIKIMTNFKNISYPQRIIVPITSASSPKETWILRCTETNTNSKILFKYSQTTPFSKIIINKLSYNIDAILGDCCIQSQKNSLYNVMYCTPWCTHEAIVQSWQKKSIILNKLCFLNNHGVSVVRQDEFLCFQKNAVWTKLKNTEDLLWLCSSSICAVLFVQFYLCGFNMMNVFVLIHHII